MEARKTALMSLFAGQQWRCRDREAMGGHSWGRRAWADWEAHGSVYANIRETDSRGNLLSSRGSSTRCPLPT